MNSNYILSTIFLFTLLACKTETDKATQRESKKRDYELVEEAAGIMVEKFDSTNVDDNKYNHNNQVYKVGSVYKYHFEHQTVDGQVKFFSTTDDGWEFIDAKDTNEYTIRDLQISVASGNPMSEHIPDYNQTTLTYRLGQENNFSMSGAIENEANIWIHPPRAHYFRILELNPFPYIKAPYEIGTEWTWSLNIGDHWQDARWKTWEGGIENEYQYKINCMRTLTTALGEVDCFVIESTAKSRIGETALTAYFHPEYGFVKLDYTNIDGSKTILEMVEKS